MLLDDDSLNKLTGLILAAAIEVHRRLGPGLLHAGYGQDGRTADQLQRPEAHGWREAPHYSGTRNN
jgi:hypothetical protein